MSVYVLKAITLLAHIMLLHAKEEDLKENILFF